MSFRSSLKNLASSKRWTASPAYFQTPSLSPILKSSLPCLSNLRYSSSNTASASVQAEEAIQENEAEKEINVKLQQSFPGGQILVQDVSGGCGTFYAISIIHDQFKGLSTIKQHRLVNEILKEDLKNWHGVQLKTMAP